jgi:RNA polymerase sigma-70 factor (ECF subfamily)
LARSYEDGNAEKELLELLKRNPRAGFTRLFDEYFDEVCGHIYRYIPDTRIAKDVAQDLFVELWTKRNNLNITSSAGAYLHRMSVSRALNYIRDNKKSRHADITGMHMVQAEQPLPDQVMDARSMNDMITNTIDGLPERCRQVFMLSRFEQMTNAEIAEALEISVKTVENQMTKALKVIREAIEKYRSSE